MAGLLLPTVPGSPVTICGEGCGPVRVSLIVAFYRESEATFRRCAEGLRGIHYPVDLLEVIWVVDKSDRAATEHARKAIARVGKASSWKILETDAISPRADAINAGLTESSGQVLGLLDADAVPEPAQLRKAVAALDSGRWEAVESPQFAELGGQRWLAGLVRAEEAAWFASMRCMDWLTGTHMLAGSSIYFTREIYDAVGPFVGPWGEEPVDWSLRFAGLGFRAAVLESITTIIPFRNLWAGLLQRRRWFKGQTECLLRAMRSPSATRSKVLAGAVLASNLAVLMVLPAFIAGAASRTARLLLATIVALESLRIVATLAVSRQWRECVPKRGWLLLLPWELLSTIGYWLGLVDWFTGRKTWDRARD